MNCRYRRKKGDNSPPTLSSSHHYERGTRRRAVSTTLEQECCLQRENVNRCFDSGDRNVTYASARGRGPTCTCICLGKTRSASLLTNRARQKARGVTPKTKRNEPIFSVGGTYLLTRPFSKEHGQNHSAQVISETPKDTGPLVWRSGYAGSGW